MNRCTALEPPPTRFYAPLGMFTPQDLQQLSAQWLGNTIVSPGGSFRYRVISGPLCRLYWERGKAEPNINESAYIQDERGRWRRSHSNYLSYQVEGGGFVTVRWKEPMQQTISSSMIRAAVNPLRGSVLSCDIADHIRATASPRIPCLG